MKKGFLIWLLFFVLWMDAGCQSKDNWQVVFKGAGEGIGTQGPIYLEAKQQDLFDPSTSVITIIPHVELDLNRSNDSLEIRPKAYFLPGQKYVLTLAVKDTRALSTREMKQFSWEFKTNPACLLYLAPMTQSPEIWRYCLDDQIKIQLSHTEGRVLGFSPSPDGKWIVYTTRNKIGGSDIWLMDRNGEVLKRLFQCGQDTCSDIKFVDDEKTIAFIKKIQNTVNRNPHWTSELYLMEMIEQKTSIFKPDEKLNPILVDMNTREKRLTFFEQGSSSIWIYDFQLETTNILPSGEGLGGSWSRSNGFFTFARMNFWGGIPYGEIFEYDPFSGATTLFVNGKDEASEFFSPKWRPQGDWLAVGIRPVAGSSSKQIILISKNKEQRMNVSLDQTYSYGSFSWSSDGNVIAYQRFQMGVSNTLPQVGLWRLEDGSHFILEENAANPQWIP